MLKHFYFYYMPIICQCIYLYIYANIYYLYDHRHELLCALSTTKEWSIQRICSWYIYLKAFTYIKTLDEMKLHKLNAVCCVGRKEMTNRLWLAYRDWKVGLLGFLGGFFSNITIILYSTQPCPKYPYLLIPQLN